MSNENKYIHSNTVSSDMKEEINKCSDTVSSDMKEEINKYSREEVVKKDSETFDITKLNLGSMKIGLETDNRIIYLKKENNKK